MVLNFLTLMIYVLPMIIFQFILNLINEAWKWSLYILICLVLFIIYMKYQASISILVFGKFFWILVLFCTIFYWDIFYNNNNKENFKWAIFPNTTSPTVSKIIHDSRNNITTLRDALVTATPVTCNSRDPPIITNPFAYLASGIPDVPDGMIMCKFYVIENAIVFIWPILTITVSLTFWLLFQRFFLLHYYATTKMRKKPKHQKWQRNRSHKQKYKKQQVLPKNCVKYFLTSDKTDGIMF